MHAHGWYAWAQLQTGDVDVELDAIRPATALGTRDALLLDHAGAIHFAAGEVDRGTDLLDRALELNPEFDPDHADRARELLDGETRPAGAS